MLIISNTLAGCLSDDFVRRRFMDKTKLRKSFQTFAIMGANICLILVTVFQESSSKAVIICLIAAMFFSGFNTGGDVPIILDMTTDFCATVFAIANGICSLCGFLAPLLTGKFK